MSSEWLGPICNACGGKFLDGEDYRDHLPCPVPKKVSEPIVEVAREKLSKKVFVCISGSYSDKAVAAVFTKEADARRCEELFNWDVEEREIDSIHVSAFPENVRCFRATIRGDEVASLNVNDGPPDGWEKGVGEEYYGSFWAKSEERALDLAWEKLLEVSPHPAEALARNEKRKRDREETAKRVAANREWFKGQAKQNRDSLAGLDLVPEDAISTGIAFPWQKKPPT